MYTPVDRNTRWTCWPSRVCVGGGPLGAAEGLRRRGGLVARLPLLREVPAADAVPRRRRAGRHRRHPLLPRRQRLPRQLLQLLLLLLRHPQDGISTWVSSAGRPGVEAAAAASHHVHGHWQVPTATAAADVAVAGVRRAVGGGRRIGEIGGRGKVLVGRVLEAAGQQGQPSRAAQARAQWFRMHINYMTACAASAIS